MWVDDDTSAVGWGNRVRRPGLLTVWRDRRSVYRIGGVAIVYLIVVTVDHLVAPWVSLPLPGPGLVVAAGLLLGPVAAWGVSIGAVTGDLLGGTLAFDSVVGFLGHFLLAVLAYRLWGAFGVAPDDEPAGAPTVSNVGEYVLVATTATAFVVGATAWGYLLVGTSTFPAVVQDALPDYLVSALVVGPVALYSVSWYADRRGIRSVRCGAATDHLTASGAILVLYSSVGWPIFGFGVGTVFQAAALESPHLLVNRLGRWVLPVLDLAGPGGLHLQIAVGAVAVGLFLWGLTRG